MKIGLIGTGFIARGFSHAIKNDNELLISRVLTRRDPNVVDGLAVDNSKITNSVHELVNNSGDPIYATDVLATVLEAGIAVVTMDSELQVTTGSWLARKGLITEAEGDQPGSMAALLLDVLSMGFEPVVYGNIKGFLNRTPTLDQMKYWSEKLCINLDKVTSFTDGTKLQIEQALIANGLVAKILQQGMTGIKCDDYMEGAFELSEKADEAKSIISDYVLSPKSPPGVFITAKHKKEQTQYLSNYKLGEGPYYILTKPFHLCHLEIPKTIRNVLKGEGVLLNNTDHPKISVASVAKKKLLAGEKIKKGIGSFYLRGETVNINEVRNHLPIGLASDIVIKKNIERGQIVTFDDVDIPESNAVHAWMSILKDTD